MKRTYVDAGVLIAAFRGDSIISRRAMEVLDDPSRELVVSDFLKLEVLPKPTFHNRTEEVEFMNTVFESAAGNVPCDPAVTKKAIELASNYDMAPMDALHAGAAVVAGVDELVTLEKPSKPLCMVKEVKVVSIHLESNGNG